MQIVIIGGGAIGRLFGYYLAREGHRVVVADTDPEVVQALGRNGVEFLGLNQNNPEASSRAEVRAVEELDQVERCDLVLLTVKSVFTEAAATAAAHLVSPQTPLLSLQTGLGNIEILQKRLPLEAILAGFTLMSGTALGGSKVRHGGHGTTYVGELDGTLTDRLAWICELFQDCGLPTLGVRRIQGRLWSTVLIYGAINPVSAILRIANGRLLLREDSRKLMQRLLDEGAAVAGARGIDLVHPDLWEELAEVCEQSANTLSPMLQDILIERATEIEAQSGMICAYGEEVGLPAPTHRAMVDLIRLIEYWRPGSEYRW